MNEIKIKNERLQNENDIIKINLSQIQVDSKIN
jgi:hypothetical protein